MAEKKIQARIRQKVDTKANWDKATNFVPLNGEYIYYSDLHKVKVGDGVTKVGSLPFLADSDSKVTSVANHYTPAADSSAQLSVDASSTTAATWNSTSLVTGVNLQRDAKGHVTGITVDSVKMPANPNTDTNTHFTTGLYIGTANTKANGATTNGNTYLKAYDDNTRRAQFLIHGSGATSVSSDANGNITISSTDTNTDTHFTTGLYVGKANEKSNSATTNGNTYLKLFDNDTKRTQHLINGTGLTTVTSDASGTITINSTLPTNLVTTDTEQTVTGTKHFNAITANTIGTGSDANNYFQSQKFRGEGDANTYYHAVDFGYAGHNQVDFYEYGGNYNFYINTQANTDSRQLLFGINPSGIKIPPAAGAKVLGTNAEGQVESHSLGIADISSLQSTLDGKVNSSSLATVAKTGSYNDLSNKPTIPNTSNLVPYTGATKDVDLGKHSLSISNKSDGKGKITVSSQGISEDDIYCEITSTGVQLMDPGAGTSYNVNYIDVNGFKVYLPNATYVPSGAEVFAMKSNLSNLLDKGSASTNNNQVVYNPVEMKKALTVPSVQGTKYTDSSGNQQSLFELGGTADANSGSSSLTLYRNRAGSWDSVSISMTPADGLKIGNYAVGVQNWSNVPASYILTNGDGVTKDSNGGVKLKSSGGASSDDFVFESTNNGKLHSKMSIGPSGLVRGGWCIDNSKILTESSLTTQQWKLTSTSGTVTTINICTK